VGSGGVERLAGIAGGDAGGDGGGEMSSGTVNASLRLSRMLPTTSSCTS
jgi:hypothetical protein